LKNLGKTEGKNYERNGQVGKGYRKVQQMDRGPGHREVAGDRKEVQNLSYWHINDFLGGFSKS
jgi:hypothetical protein